MLPGIIQTGKKQGMRLMDDTLIELYQRGLISAQEAYARADQKQMVRQQLELDMTRITQIKSTRSRIDLRLARLGLLSCYPRNRRF